MKFLTVDDICLIHIQVIDASGGSHGIRDIHRIESAAAACQQSAFGEDLYPTLFHKAAVITRGIICDHPFIDGNKRTAMIAALVFLNMNGCDTKILSDKELEDFAVRAATDHLDIAEIAAWFKNHTDS